MVNFVYDAATPAKRARCRAYFNVMNGCGVSLGALAGGWLLTWLPELDGSRFLALFVCSGSVRLLAVAGFWAVHRRYGRSERSGCGSSSTISSVSR